MKYVILLKNDDVIDFLTSGPDCTVQERTLRRRTQTATQLCTWSCCRWNKAARPAPRWLTSSTFCSVFNQRTWTKRPPSKRH